MSEKNIKSYEHSALPEAHAHENNERAAKHTAEHAERARREKSKENLDKIKELAKLEAESADKVNLLESPTDESDSLIGVQHSMKANAYERTLSRAQQKLSAPARSFSRIVHSPVVDKFSEIGASTVARPSGLLGGSICAFVGSVILLYYSKHYGFKYNYMFLFLLFALGFIVGAVIELLVWFLYSRKRNYH